MCIIKPLLVYICVLLGSFASVQGSVITFQSTPHTVIEGLTEHVDLRCSLQDTAASANIIGRRDVTMTTANVDQVFSIIIMKNGVDVASVAANHPAKVMVNDTNIHVSGDVTMVTGERGFLEISVQHPTPAQVGEYRCEIVVLSATGHGAIFTTNTEVNSSLPTIDYLVNEVNNGKIKIQTLQQTVASLQQQINNLQACDDFNTSSGLHVRLIGGVDGSSGAVELRYNGTTGMLCDDDFDRNNNGAQVVCRMLGYSTGVYEDGNHYAPTGVYLDGNHYTTSSSRRIAGLYLLDDVVCTGSETDLTKCSGRSDWSPVNVCNYDELAGVRCS